LKPLSFLVDDRVASCQVLHYETGQNSTNPEKTGQFEVQNRAFRKTTFYFRKINDKVSTIKRYQSTINRLLACFDNSEFELNNSRACDYAAFT
jgi:hypothetical protein